MARIQGVGRLEKKMKIHLVISARADAYWQEGVSREAAMGTTLERGRAYLQAGADCIFVPGLTKPEHIRSVVEHLIAPVNVLGLAGMPGIPELGKLGVKRGSMGAVPRPVAISPFRPFPNRVRTT